VEEVEVTVTVTVPVPGDSSNAVDVTVATMTRLPEAMFVSFVPTVVESESGRVKWRG
jgi:hypothetical protein